MVDAEKEMAHITLSLFLLLAQIYIATLKGGFQIWGQIILQFPKGSIFLRGGPEVYGFFQWMIAFILMMCNY